jgi:hypothetical protein
MLYVRSARRAPRSPFITDITDAKPHGQSSRSKATVPIIAPPNSVPRRKPPPDYFDSLDLRAEYLSVFADVQALRPEVQSHRELYIRLKNELFLQNRTDLGSEIEYAELAPRLNAAVGRGAFATAINGLAAQSRECHAEIVDLKEQTAPPMIMRLDLQVLSARAELLALRKSIDEMRDAERATRAEIEAMHTQFPPERTEGQREVIRTLVNNIRAIERKNAALNHEVEELEAAADRRSLPFERQVECDAIEDMSGQLDGKRHQYYDKCTELIDIRSQQLKEVVTAEDMSRPASDRRITVAEAPPARRPPEEEDTFDGDWASGSEDVQIGFGDD